MTDEDAKKLLELLKVDLRILSGVYDERLLMLLKSADAGIRREGAAPDYTSPEDMHIAVMYAAWLWNRRDTGEGMPRMLRWALNNRVLSERMK